MCNNNKVFTIPPSCVTLALMKVRKEATVAVIIGLVLGLIVVGGVVRARQALQQMQKENSEAASVGQNGPTPLGAPSGLFLTIETPDNSVSNDSALTVSGKTLAGTYIAIIGEKGEYLIVPNSIGSFSQDVALATGANTITVTVYQADGTHVAKTLNAVYTTAGL